VRLSAEETADLLRRLRRAEGQIRGLQQMIEEGRECRDVATQFAAASRAVRGAGHHYLSRTMSRCLADPEAAIADGYDPAVLERLFVSL
jgi:DNA-binding FrmR family transcriptional regulator